MEYEILVRNHWWFDSGIIGLYNIAKDCARDVERFNGIIEPILRSDRVIFKTEEPKMLKEFLESCYEKLTDKYWNVSTEKQITNKDKDGYLYYNKDKDNFEFLPKMIQMPLISNMIKGSSYRPKPMDLIEFTKKIHSELDNEYIKNQAKLYKDKIDNLFLTYRGKTPEKYEIYTEKKQCHKQIDIPSFESLGEDLKAKTVCSVCGKFAEKKEGISQTAYFLFASKSAALSFHSGGKNLPNICWECEFISKFAFENILYKQEDENLIFFTIFSPDLKHMRDICDKLKEEKVFDNKCYIHRNIGISDNKITYYSCLTNEMIYAYFADCMDIDLNSEIKSMEENIFFEQMIKKPTSLIMFSAFLKGKTLVVDNSIIYNDLSYLYRLICEINSELKLKNNKYTQKYLFISLFDWNMYNNGKKNGALQRERIFKKILSKQSITSDVEEVCYKSISSDSNINVDMLLTFTKAYQTKVKGDIMTKEQIDVAVKLGSQIVLAAKEKTGSKDSAKKDIFMLRKCRTKADFLTQLSRIQMRYGIIISSEVTHGILEDVNFEEFRSYCVMGALNVFSNKGTDKSQ